MHKAWTELRTIQIHHQPAHGLGPFPPSTSQPQVRLASSTSRQRGATQHPPWTPLFPPRPNPTQMLQNTHVVHKCAKSSHSTVESDCKTTWFLGHPSFTHNYCRSRIITVVHARFTLFHAPRFWTSPAVVNQLCCAPIHLVHGILVQSCLKA